MLDTSDMFSLNEMLVFNTRELFSLPLSEILMFDAKI